MKQGTLYWNGKTLGDSFLLLFRALTHKSNCKNKEILTKMSHLIKSWRQLAQIDNKPQA